MIPLIRISSVSGWNANLLSECENLTVFSCIENRLYELDGRKDDAIDHGDSSPSTLLQDACKVIKQFIARDPDEVRFTILALAHTVADE